MAELFYGFCIYACGHTESIEVPEEQKGMSTNVPVMCPNCRIKAKGEETEIDKKIKKRKEIEEQTKKDAIGNKTKGADINIPELKGISEKAINYAQKLRSAFISKWTLNGELTPKALDAVTFETTAQFWLDNKDNLEDWEWLQSVVLVDQTALEQLTLAGTEAQVKWARNIRIAFMRGLGTLYPDIVDNEKTAKFWIDNQENLKDEQWIINEYVPTIETEDITKGIKLIGTPAQIKSAKTVIKELAKWSMQYLEPAYQDKALKLIKMQTSAIWWLRYRDKLYNQDFIAKATVGEAAITEETIAALEREKFLAERDKEVAIIPPKGNGISVRITCQRESLIITSEATKDKEFQHFLKENFIYYDGELWRRDLDNRLTGHFLDRAAEIGIKLYDLGYTVCIYSERAREMLRNRTFIPEHTRWVINIDDGNMAFIERNRENLEDVKLLSLPGAYADADVLKGVVVPYREESIAAVTNYINTHGYKMEDIAKIKIIKYLKKAVEKEKRK